MSRRILGLDVATRTGWCRIVDDLYTWGTWDLDNPNYGMSRPAALACELERVLSARLTAIPPDVVVMEKVQFVISYAQITLWAAFATVVRLMCEKERIPLIEVPAGTLKKFATGKGSAKKNAMIEAALARLEPGSDMTSDEADAFHLVRYGEENAA